jgi:hypothetical protein
MRSGEVQFEFVISDPVSNPKPGKSLQIRSRCMHGKNKREGSRRSEQEKKRKAKETSTTVKSRLTPIHPIVPTPMPLISDFVPIRFTGRSIDSGAKALLYEAYVHNFLDSTVTPLERCVNLDCLESSSYSWLFTDTAYLHSVLSASYAIRDFSSPQWNGKPGRKTMFHIQEAISMLRIKMQSQDVCQDETVLRVVINLTLLAAVYGDWVAAAAHFEGLHKIVHLRGDMAFLKERPALHFKLDRIDLAWSLSSGRKPHFAQPVKSWGYIRPVPKIPLPSNLYQAAPDWDYRVVNVFNKFQDLSLMVNRNRLRFVLHDPSIFQDDLTVLQSRLVALADIVIKPVEKLVRLVMLATMTTLFSIPGRRVPYDWIIEQLRKTFIKASDEIMWDKSLLLWVLIMSSFTVANTQHSWIRDAWATVGAGLEWVEVKAHLSRVIWFEVVHDEPGEMAYQQLKMSQLLSQDFSFNAA